LELGEDSRNGFALDQVDSQNNFAGVAGTSAAIKAVLNQVEIVAPTDSTVLILGGNGYGERINCSRHSQSQSAGRAGAREGELRCDPNGVA
jgi:formate hydrogenlyase transcriptional activator